MTQHEIIAAFYADTLSPDLALFMLVKLGLSELDAALALVHGRSDTPTYTLR